MREAGPRGLARLLAARLDPQTREEWFDPAFHDLLAERAAGRVKRGLFAVRALGLAVECLRLQRVRGPVRRRRSGVSEFANDVRWALRGLRARPGFTAVMVLTLALGIGATTAIFSIVNGVLLRPLPYAASDRLATFVVMGPRDQYVSVSVPNLKNWRERARTFETMAAAASWNITDRTNETAEVLRGQIVLGDFFETLGVAPLLGRTIPASATDAGAPAVAVLSYGLWQRQFGGDAEVLGRVLLLNGDAVTVVGVMPPGFGYPSADETDVYLPMGMMAENLPWTDHHSSFGGNIVARLAPGATPATAQADMDRITRELEAEAGERIATVEVVGLADRIVADVRAPVLVLMGAVAFVLLIACVNVANLLLSRAEGRRRETALRVALGAGRAAILRQSFAESLVLSVAGGLLGIALAAGAVRVLVSRLSDAIPAVVAPSIRVDGTVLAFTSLIVLLGAALFTLLPAWRGARGARLADVLREGGRGGTGSRAGQHLRAGLVIAEISLALVLVVGAGLMIQTLTELRDGEGGFTAGGVMTARVSLPPGGSPDADQWRARFETLTDAVAEAPGVRSAASMLLLPLARRSWELLVQTDEEPFEPNRGRSVLFNVVTLDYFETLDIPIVRGRNFTPDDRDGTTPVTIIDETMAALLWPGEDPLGRRVTFDYALESTRENPVPVYRTVVGVVPNVRHYELREPSRIQVYVPHRQSSRQWGGSLFVAARAAPGAATSDLATFRDAIRAVEPGAAITELTTLDSYVRGKLARERALSTLLGTFGGLALLLAGVGVFGVMTMRVATRSREIGVRLAMGARPAGVLLMVLRGSTRLAVAGTLIGVLAAALLSRLIASLLYGVSPLDAGVYVAAASFLVVVALTATVIPAVRAARLDPLATLRQDA